MTLIVYRERKALLLTTDDIMKIDKDPKYRRKIQNIIETARHDNIYCILILTDLIKSSIPIWLRSYLDHNINCYRGFFSTSEGLQK